MKKRFKNKILLLLLMLAPACVVRCSGGSGDAANNSQGFGGAPRLVDNYFGYYNHVLPGGALQPHSTAAPVDIDVTVNFDYVRIMINGGFLDDLVGNSNSASAGDALGSSRALGSRKHSLEEPPSGAASVLDTADISTAVSASSSSTLSAGSHVAVVATEAASASVAQASGVAGGGGTFLDRRATTTRVELPNINPKAVADPVHASAESASASSSARPILNNYDSEEIKKINIQLRKSLRRKTSPAYKDSLFVELADKCNPLLKSRKVSGVTLLEAVIIKRTSFRAAFLLLQRILNMGKSYKAKAIEILEGLKHKMIVNDKTDQYENFSLAVIYEFMNYLNTGIRGGFVQKSKSGNKHFINKNPLKRAIDKDLKNTAESASASTGLGAAAVAVKKKRKASAMSSSAAHSVVPVQNIKRPTEKATKRNTRLDSASSDLSTTDAPLASTASANELRRRSWLKKIDPVRAAKIATAAQAAAKQLLATARTKRSATAAGVTGSTVDAPAPKAQRPTEKATKRNTQRNSGSGSDSSDDGEL